MRVEAIDVLPTEPAEKAYQPRLLDFPSFVGEPICGDCVG